ncbi:MAG TPA: hypothetical protein VIL11_04080 [Limnochordales bacterium]
MPVLPVVAATPWLAEGAAPAPGRLAWMAVALAGVLATARLADALAEGAASWSRQLSRMAAAVGAALALLYAAARLEPGSLAWSLALPLGMVMASSLRRWGTGPTGPVACSAWAATRALFVLWAWAALRGVPEGPAWLLAAGTALWLTGSAVLYEPAGPASVAAANAALAGALALSAAAGWAAGRERWYFAGLAAACVVLGLRQRLAARQARRGRWLPGMWVWDLVAAGLAAAGMVADVYLAPPLA